MRSIRVYRGYLLSKMKQIDEDGGTTMLDNVMRLFGSNMFNGDGHDGRNLPLVLAGHGGGRIPAGKAIDHSADQEEQQRACNLYVSIAQHMGLDLPRFGDSFICSGTFKLWPTEGTARAVLVCCHTEIA